MFILDFIYALHMPVLRMRLGGPLAAPFLSFISALFLFPLICYFLFQIDPTLCLADPVVDVNRVESDYLGIMFLCKVCISN